MTAHGRRLAIVLLCVLACLPSSGAFARPALGTNLGGIADWSTDHPFTDVFKTSRPWISGTLKQWSDGRAFDLDEHGWIRSLAPGQVARTLMFWELHRRPGRYPAGRYVVDYDGEGTMEIDGGARLMEASPGRRVIDVHPERGPGIALTITATNPANYLRNIRVYREGTDPARDILNPRFVESVRPFRILRFMDWMATNGRRGAGSSQAQWKDRPSLADARWSGGRGVPLEVMVLLANAIQADAWFPMPHGADDEYIDRFAALAARRLDSKLKVYVEHSNEVWNRIFGQARHAEQRGMELGLGSDPRTAGARYHARRSMEIFAIWERHLPKARLVKVLGAQAANDWYSRVALSFRDTASRIDALGIAPYFGVRKDEYAEIMRMDVETFMRWLRRRALPRARADMEKQARIARDFKVDLVAYEAGQHLVGAGKSMDDPALNQLFDAANRHPGMRPIYAEYLGDWAAVSDGPIVHFSHCGHYRKTGRFGALEYLEQPRSEAPKYDALLNYLEGVGMEKSRTGNGRAMQVRAGH